MSDANDRSAGNAEQAAGSGAKEGIGATVVSVVLALAVAFALAQGGAQWNGQPLVLWAMGLAFVINWMVYIPSFLARTEHYFDLTGTLTYLSVTGFVLVASPSVTGAFAVDAPPLTPSSPVVRHLVVAAVVAIWALRLGTFLFTRIKAAGKDGRFDELKKRALRFLVPWSLQGLWVSLTLSAALAVLTTPPTVEFGIFGFAGLLVWGLGFGLEVVSDRQKSAFKADPANAGRFITTGLWRYSRHPNYFGEIILWAGVALMALPTLEGWRFVGLISPLFVTVLLAKISGLPMLEDRADKKWGGEAEYERYKRTTSILVLWPPRAD